MPTIQDEAKQIAAVIAEKYKPEKIILFGSATRGDTHTDSDIDLLIIKQSGKKKAYRIKDVFTSLRGIQRNYALDPLVYTPEELHRRLTIGDYFVKTIIDEGQTLYG